jgi:hypothetical protein
MAFVHKSFFAVPLALFVTVPLWTRPIVPPDRLKGFDGPAARVVGLSFRTTNDNPDKDILCTIEDGKVVIPPPAVVVVADESTAERQLMQVPLIQMT